MIKNYYTKLRVYILLTNVYFVKIADAIEHTYLMCENVLKPWKETENWVIIVNIVDQENKSGCTTNYQTTHMVVKSIEYAILVWSEIWGRALFKEFQAYTRKEKTGKIMSIVDVKHNCEVHGNTINRYYNK